MKYSSDNQLAFDPQPDGSYFVFLTNKATEHLEEVVMVFFPHREPSELLLKEGAPIAVIESTKSAIDIQAPFDLTLLNVNEALITSPYLLTDLEKGWLARVAIDSSHTHFLTEDF